MAVRINYELSVCEIDIGLEGTWEEQFSYFVLFVFMVVPNSANHLLSARSIPKTVQRTTHMVVQAEPPFLIQIIPCRQTASSIKTWLHLC